MSVAVGNVFYARRSGEIARNRLKLLLAADKAGCSPDMIRMIKDDMIHVISKYMEIDKDRLQLRMDSLETGSLLCVSIPIRSVPNKGMY